MPAFYSVLCLRFLFIQQKFLQDIYFEIMSLVNWSVLGNLAREKKRDKTLSLSILRLTEGKNQYFFPISKDFQA